MTRKTVWLVSVGTLLCFALIAFLATTFLHLKRSDAAVLWSGLLALGLGAAGLVFYYLWKKAAATPPPVAADDEINAAFLAAAKRLSASPATRRAKIGNLPVVIVLGPSSSTKTSLVLQSGLEPELLAGQIYRGEALVPTQPINIWYAQGTIVIEAGGELLLDPARRARLLHHVRPSRWRSALSRGKAQAPRVAVVCFPCDELAKAGATATALAEARTLRTCIQEVAEKLGIRLPVYVFFTKADRLQYFDDYVRSFTRDETQEVLGATLPAMQESAPGVYAEREGERLTAVFAELFRSLALRRTNILGRETRDEVRAGAYEFPREFRKAADVATQFLIELCKPSQLGLSPFLRGFYFTGVRAVVVSDAGPIEVRTPQAGSALSIAATSVFSARDLLANQAAQSRTTGRRVPEWVFVNRLFRSVILSDRAAMAATGGGTRVNFARRAVAAVAFGLFLFLAVGFTVSFARNSDLEHAALSASRNLAEIDRTTLEQPSLSAFNRLDSTREVAAKIRTYEQKGHPWWSGFGLYTGADLLPPLRQLYFARFDQMLWGRTRTALTGMLRALPDQPDENTRYDAVYSALKAHLVTTSENKRAQPDSLPAVLVALWPDGRTADAQRQALAEQQFEFFADELRVDKPTKDEVDTEIVNRARALLRRAQGIDQFYQVMIGGAAGKIPAVRYDAAFPGSTSVLQDAYVVPGAFTRQGWSIIESDLRNLDRLTPEKWVVGDATLSADERAKLATGLHERYISDYIRHWMHYLQAASVSDFGSAEDAVTKLTRLSGNDSPVLQVLALAAQNTAIDSVVAASFQPLHAIMPPGVTDKFLVDSNKDYIAALSKLLESLSQVAVTPPGPARSAAAAQASGTAAQASGAVRALTQSFTSKGDARPVGDAVRRILEMPIATTASVVAALPGAEVNRKGAAFCEQFGGLFRKFPFNRVAASEASIEEVTQALQRGTGGLWTFYESSLQDLIVQQGPRFAPRPGASPQPTRAFMDYFNSAADVSRALYDEGGLGPQITFAIRPEFPADLPDISITVDRRTEQFSRTSSAGRTFDWIGARTRDVKITGRAANGSEVQLLHPPAGAWSVFRLFYQGEWEPRGNGHYGVRWQIPGRAPFTVDVSFAGGVPVFMPGYLGRVSCIARIAGLDTNEPASLALNLNR